MKILILSNNDSGLYKFRRELLEELVKKNIVYFCVPKGEYIENIEKMGCQFIPCAFLERHGKNPIKEIKLFRFYKHLAYSIKPDVVLTYTIKPNIYGGIACARLNIPYIVNITGLGSAVECKGFLRKITVFLYKYGLRKAQKIFFQNRENRNFMLKKGIVRTSYDILPGSGVNLNQYKLFDYPNNDTIDFVFVSRIMKSKGIEQYLDAAKYIRVKYPYTRFHVCGNCEEEYNAELKKLSKEGVIIYHALVKDMTEIYKIISCTVHPSYYPEGISNVLLESAASGRPVITTDRSGCREVVEDGINGFIVKQKDSRDLIEKIEHFLSLPQSKRKEMGIMGRKKVEKEFNRKIVVNKYLEEIDKVRIIYGL